MKTLSYLTIFILPFLFHSCNEAANINSEIKDIPIDTLPTIICKRHFEIYPKYKNGTNQELLKIIQSQLEYPTEECIQGTTVLSVYFDEKGRIDSTKIYRSLSKSIDDQLEALVRKYEFEPGKVNGESQFFVINFPFKIELE